MLGTELCKVLAADHEVAGLDIIRSQVSGRRSQVFYEGDITDPDRVDEVIEEARPDLVIHAAAWTDVDGCENDPDKAYAVNTDGTYNLVKSAGKRDIPFLLISTDFVFEGEKGTPYDEGEEGSPLSVYGKSKWRAEQLVKRALSRFAIVRTSWLYGAGGRNFVDTVIAKAKSGEALRVVNDQVGSPTYAGDLAKALKDLIAAVDGFSGEVYHISNSGQCSWYDFACRALEEAGVDAEVSEITSAELDRPAPRPKFSVMSTEKFSGIVGRKMRPWEDALREYINDWYGGSGDTSA